MKLVVIGGSARHEPHAEAIAAALGARGHDVVRAADGIDGAQMLVAIGTADAEGVVAALTRARRHDVPSVLLCESASGCRTAPDWVIAPSPDVLDSLSSATGLPPFRLVAIPSAFTTLEPEAAGACERALAKMSAMGPYRPPVPHLVVAIGRPLIRLVASFSPVETRQEAWHRRKRRLAHLRRMVVGTPRHALFTAIHAVRDGFRRAHGEVRWWLLKTLPRQLHALSRVPNLAVRRVQKVGGRAAAAGRRLRKKAAAAWRGIRSAALQRIASPRR
jgi:hypothetical protein